MLLTMPYGILIQISIQDGYSSTSGEAIGFNANECRILMRSIFRSSIYESDSMDYTLQANSPCITLDMETELDLMELYRYGSIL